MTAGRLEPLPPEHTPELKPLFDSFRRTLGFVPNSALTMQRKPKLTDAMFAELRKYWDEEQITEIMGVIAAMGFVTRWNDSLATPIEEEALAVGETYLAAAGWQAGKHLR